MITITTEDTNLVRSIARRYAQCNVPLQDLMQEGYIGLIYAKRHFDPARGIPFSNYAARWIRKYILAALKLYGNTVHLPQHNTSAMEHCISESLDKPVKVEDGEVLTYTDILRDETPGADETMILDERYRMLYRALQQLTPRELNVVRRMHGLHGSSPMTREQLSQDMNVSIEVIHKIYQRALKKLRFFVHKMEK